MVFELFNENLQELIKKRFEKPTLSQKLAIPKILERKNILLQAPIASGKTEAAIWPVLNFIIKEKLKPIAALYITPLRALNRDMLERLIWWCNELGLDIGVRHSDTAAYERKLQAEFPPHLLILTPETLQAILPGKKMKKHLANVRFVVVDELHELVDSKRGSQLTIGLRRLRELAGKFQVIGLSATIGSPEEVASFISPGEPIEVVKVIFPKQFEIKVISPKPEPVDKKLAVKIFSSRETSARLREVMQLIEKSKATLMFTNTREFAEILASRIKTLKKDFSTEVHHSSLSREIRIRVEKEFKQEKLRSLIATSSLELGIDIGAIEQVLQYMSPRQVTQAIQRIGRSGHVLEKISKGKIIATNEDDVFESAVVARKALVEELEKIKFHEKSLDVLAHQIVGLTLDFGRMDVEKAFEIIKNAYPYKRLSLDEFLRVCRQLEKLGLIWLNP
ncbi:MAG: DEAD/DEAH box helicase [Candidatus Aenigmarchaeota archaeon]|nr:DEAD/DEAH box helicase [Candidatus Aenigmarchaeota archaeon]